MSINANSVPGLVYQDGLRTYTEQLPTIQSDPFRSLNSPYKVLKFPDGDMIKLTSREVTFSPNALGNTTHIYTTPLLEDIQELSAYFTDWGASWQVKEGPLYTITVQAPWDTISSQDWYISQFASDQWEIVPQMGMKNLVYSGLLNYPFRPPSDSNNYIILPPQLQAAVNYSKNNDMTTLVIPTSGTFNSGTFASISAYIPMANIILSYQRMGVEGIPSYTQILKRTAVIDNQNNNGAFATAADEAQRQINGQGSVNYLLSTPDLIKKYSVPNTKAKFLLPSYRKRITIININMTESFTYAGWLVKPPSIQFIGANKMQITQEFIWDEYLCYLYYINSPISDFPQVLDVNN